MTETTEQRRRREEDERRRRSSSTYEDSLMSHMHPLSPLNPAFDSGYSYTPSDSCSTDYSSSSDSGSCN